jgi:hypothetical protein
MGNILMSRSGTPTAPLQTPEYRDFVETWARHCGAPPATFRGQLDATIIAELVAAGRDVIGYAEDLARRGERFRRATDRLLADLDAFLARFAWTDDHDEAQALSERIARARDYLQAPPGRAS